VAAVTTPIMAIATRGRFYLRRRTDGIAAPLLDADGNPSAERLRCHVTGYTFERPDMLASAERGPRGEMQYVSSLALTLDASDRYVLPAERPVVPDKTKRVRGTHDDRDTARGAGT
jgi:hypothetical protein